MEGILEKQDEILGEFEEILEHFLRIDLGKIKKRGF